MQHPAYNTAKLADYLTRYRLNGSTIRATRTGMWEIMRDRDDERIVVGIRPDGDVFVYVCDLATMVDRSQHVECGRMTSAIDAERATLNAIDTLAAHIDADVQHARDHIGLVATHPRQAHPACGPVSAIDWMLNGGTEPRHT